MKKLLILFFALTSCAHNDSSDEFKNMKYPIVVIAVSKSDGSVVLRDREGTIVVGGPGWYFAEAIAQSYNVGDTLR